MAYMSNAERLETLSAAMHGRGPVLADSGCNVRRAAGGEDLLDAREEIAVVAEQIPGVELRGTYASRPLDFLVVGTRELDLKRNRLQTLPIINKLVELVPSLTKPHLGVKFDRCSYYDLGREVYFMLHPSEDEPDDAELYAERLSTFDVMAELSVPASEGADPERKPDLTVAWYGGPYVTQPGIDAMMEVIEGILPVYGNLEAARFPIPPTATK